MVFDRVLDHELKTYFMYIYTKITEVKSYAMRLVGVCYRDNQERQKKAYITASYFAVTYKHTSSVFSYP